MALRLWKNRTFGGCSATKNLTAATKTTPKYFNSRTHGISLPPTIRGGSGFSHLSPILIALDLLTLSDISSESNSRLHNSNINDISFNERAIKMRRSEEH